MHGRIVWFAADRCTIANDAAPLDVSTGRRDTGGMVTATQRSFGTILVGRSALLLEGLKLVLDRTDFQVVASASAVEELDVHPGQRDRTHLFILDAGPDPRIAARQVERCKQQCPDARVVILSEIDGSADMASLFQAGADACFKDASMPTFLKSLELVMMGLTPLPSRVLSSIRARNDACPQIVGGAPCLSAQEKRVLEGLVEGHCNKTIARELGIAVTTVKVHVKAILRKTRVRNRTQAATWAIRHIGRDSSTLETEPGPSLGAFKLPSTSPSHDLVAIVPPVAQKASNGEVAEQMVTVSGDRAIPVITPKSTLLQQISVLRSRRRVAEDEESRNEVLANINRLRELRIARDREAAASRIALSRAG